MELDRANIRSRHVRRREALREIREELERVRRSEARVAEALGSLRAARHRVEELIRNIAVEDDAVRDIIREEVAAAVDGKPLEDEPRAVRNGGVGGVRGLFSGERADGDGAATPEEESAAAEQAIHEEEDYGRAFRLVGVAVASVLVVAAVAWFGFKALRGGPETPSLVLGGDTTPVAETQVASASPEEPARETDSQQQKEDFFILLPEGASQRAAVYDSLWDARSPLFEPLMERMKEASTGRPISDALDAWEAGTLTPLQSDLLHSALVQYALTQETGARLTVDGQLLRNPCRGTSCSALLNFWETRKDSLGLPPVPADAPTDPTALRVAENVLVMGALEEANKPPG